MSEEQSEAAIRELAGEIEQTLPGTLLSVRSSATAEDLADASFAGVYDTILGVNGADQMIDAWRRCVTALQSDEARAYRESKGMDHKVRMAVLFQRLLKSDISGVLLTANPQRPFADEIIINAAYGLGEGIVSGATDPDNLILDRNSGGLRNSRVGEKLIALHFQAGKGVIETAVPREMSERSALNPDQVEQLFKLAQQVTDHIGHRQDLEWAFEGNDCFLLQVRAITSLPPESPHEVASRKFGDEYLADYTTPITRTTLIRWLEDRYFEDMARRAGRSDLLALSPLRSFCGHTYLSGSYVVAATRSVPLKQRQKVLGDWFTPILMDRIMAEPLSYVLYLRRFISELRLPAGSFSKNMAALDEHATRLKHEILPQLFTDTTKLSTTELAGRIEEINGFGLRHFDIIRVGLGRHTMLFHMILKTMLKKYSGDTNGELYQLIVSGIPGTQTGEINQTIWQLAHLMGTSGQLSNN